MATAVRLRLRLLRRLLTTVTTHRLPRDLTHLRGHPIIMITTTTNRRVRLYQSFTTHRGAQCITTTTTTTTTGTIHNNHTTAVRHRDC